MITEEKCKKYKYRGMLYFQLHQISTLQTRDLQHKLCSVIYLINLAWRF